METGISRREGAIAWTLVLFVHIGLVWLLTRAMQTELSLTASSRPLQIVYFRSVVRPLPSPPPSESATAPRQEPANSLPVPPPKTTDDQQPLAATVAGGRPTSVVFLRQGREWARRQADQPIAPPDPFARPVPDLPGNSSNRFRMQSYSPADVVNAVGIYLFAPPGYVVDPCPRNRRNITALATREDRESREALRQEVEFERRHCR